MQKQRKVYTKTNHPQREIIESYNRFSPFKGFKFQDEEIQMIHDLVRLDELGGKEDMYYSKSAACNSINGKRDLPFVKKDAFDRCKIKIERYSHLIKQIKKRLEKNKSKNKEAFENMN